MTDMTLEQVRDWLRELNMLKPYRQAADSLDSAIATIAEQRAEIERLRALYESLIYAVGNKYDNETRHETALRYIRNAEISSYPHDAARAEK